MPNSWFLRFVAGAALLCAMGTASRDVANAQILRKKAENCPERVEPVCARTRARVLATYPNECHAESDGAVVIHKDACPAVGCRMIWRPVCGRKDGRNVTFANACIAGKDNASVIAKGVCPEVCTQLAGTVCAVDDAGRRRNYPSACLAVQAGARVLHVRSCKGRRDCAVGGRSVCAIDPRTKKRTTFPTLCDAERKYATLVHEGACR
jgi:hypothetical protein